MLTSKQGFRLLGEQDEDSLYWLFLLSFSSDCDSNKHQTTNSITHVPPVDFPCWLLSKWDWTAIYQPSEVLRGSSHLGNFETKSSTRFSTVPWLCYTRAGNWCVFLWEDCFRKLAKPRLTRLLSANYTTLPETFLMLRDMQNKSRQVSGNKIKLQTSKITPKVINVLSETTSKCTAKIAPDCRDLEFATSRIPGDPHPPCSSLTLTSTFPKYSFF